MGEGEKEQGENRMKRLSVRLTAMEHQQLVVVAEKKYRGASLNQAVRLLVEDAFFDLVDNTISGLEKKEG